MQETMLDIRRSIWRLAWPAILEMTLHTLVWVVDTAMVGQLGAVAMSAVGLSGQFFYSMAYIFSAVGVGATAMIARFIGAGEKQKAATVAAHSLILSVLLGLTVAGLGFAFSFRGLNLLNLQPEVVAAASQYLNIINISAIFMIPLFVAVSIMRGLGNTRTPLVIAAIANSFNIIGDYALIFGKLGMPALGVRGAALATGGANILAAVIAVGFVLTRGTDIRLNLSQFMRLNWSIVKQLFRLSIPAAVETFMNDGGRMIYTLILAGLGAVQFAANQAAVAAESLSFMPGYGFAIAATIMVGQSLGANKTGEATRSGLTASYMGLAVMTAMSFIFLTFARPLSHIFTSDTDVINWAAACIRLAALEQPTMALNMVLAGALRGAGDTRWPMYAVIAGGWIFRMPAVYAVVFLLRWPVTAVWVVTAVDYLLRAAIVFYRFRSGAWKHVEI